MHPHLHQPLLYVAGLASNVTDADLACALETVTPFRLHLQPDDEDPSVRKGTIEFKTQEKGDLCLLFLLPSRGI